MPPLSRQRTIDLLISRLPALVKYKDHVVGLVPALNSSSYQACCCVRADSCKILAENLVHLNLHENNSVIIHIDDIVEISGLGEWYGTGIFNYNPRTQEYDPVEIDVPTDLVPTTIDLGWTAAEVDVVRPRDALGQLPEAMIHDVIRALNDAGQERLTNTIRGYLHGTTRRAEDGELTIAGNGLQYTNDQ